MPLDINDIIAMNMEVREPVRKRAKIVVDRDFELQQLRNFMDRERGMEDRAVYRFNYDGQVERVPVPIPPPAPNPNRYGGAYFNPNFEEVEQRFPEAVEEINRVADHEAPMLRAMDVQQRKAVDEMTTIAEMLDVPLIKGAAYGVEVEVEGNLLPPQINGFESKKDGSLRGESMEYVFTDPVDIKKTLLRLKRLTATLAKEPTKVDMSFRTSVHVHVNISDLTHKKLCTFLYLAFLMEEPLVRFSGESRIGNRFCLRVKDAGAKVEELVRIFSAKGRIMLLDQGIVKYSAINLATIRKYGTVEFRSMRGTIDYRILATWVSLLESLYNTAQQFDSPLDIFNYVQKNGAEALCRATFGELYNSIDYTKLKEDIEYSTSMLIQLPHEFHKGE